MDWIVIENVAPYDGRWPFDLDGSELTTREWGWIKRLAGYLPLTIEDGLSDPELIVVFAAIALRRAGRVEPQNVPQVFEQLSEAPFGSSITMETETGDEEADAGPPASSLSASDDSSGVDSTPSLETSEPTPNNSGTPASATSALPRPMLVRERRGN